MSYAAIPETPSCTPATGIATSTGAARRDTRDVKTLQPYIVGLILYVNRPNIARGRPRKPVNHNLTEANKRQDTVPTFRVASSYFNQTPPALGWTRYDTILDAARAQPPPDDQA